MIQSYIHRYRVFLLHLSFWLVYFSFSLYQISSFHHGGEYNWLNSFLFALAQMVFMIIIAYLNYAVLLPRFLKNKKIWKYLLEFSLPFIVLISIKINLIRFLVDGYAHRDWYFYSKIYVIHTTVITLFIVIFVGMLRFAEDWFEFEAKTREIENERLNAELKFLRAQINPHFLFNTLNNLYYLAYKQSPNTTVVVDKLSQMMRYMIYETNQPKVMLTKEIEYMQNYISLEKLRINDGIPIHFEIKGDPTPHRIAPMILITFLENAFKHGITNNIPDAWIDISLELRKNQMIFMVNNSKQKVKIDSENSNLTGIGLQNVRRRLDLSYSGQYELKLEDQPESFRVQLIIFLS